MNPWKFELGATVRIGGGTERGTVIGRAEYVHSEKSYFIRYVAGDGCCVEQWWTESALE